MGSNSCAPTSMDTLRIIWSSVGTIRQFCLINRVVVAGAALTRLIVRHHLGPAHRPYPQAGRSAIESQTVSTRFASTWQEIHSYVCSNPRLSGMDGLQMRRARISALSELRPRTPVGPVTCFRVS